jgi:hypothetical protein
MTSKDLQRVYGRRYFGGSIHGVEADEFAMPIGSLKSRLVGGQENTERHYNEVKISKNQS